MSGTISPTPIDSRGVFGLDTRESRVPRPNKHFHLNAPSNVKITALQALQVEHSLVEFMVEKLKVPPTISSFALQCAWKTRSKTHSRTSHSMKQYPAFYLVLENKMKFLSSHLEAAEYCYLGFSSRRIQRPSRFSAIVLHKIGR